MNRPGPAETEIVHLGWMEGFKGKLFSADPDNSCLPPDVLTLAALGYLALPNLMFFAGWFRLPFALLGTALVMLALWQFGRRRDVSWSLPHTLPALLLIALVASLWTACGGAGHFMYANADWHVRDTVLGDLVFSDWPPYYSERDGAFHILRSAIGYFLPVAMAGKWLGIGSVDILLYVWTALGTLLFLLLLPLPRRFGWMFLLLLLVPIFFSGMDFLGIVLVTGDLPMFPLRLEWWLPFSYSSLTGQLYWAPNHALALWLATVLFFRHWGHPALASLMIVLVPLLVVWTPFAVAGLLPFLGLALLRRMLAGLPSVNPGLTWLQVAIALCLSWMTIRLMTLGVAAIPGAATASYHPADDRFLLKYAVFCLMEFAILAFVLARGLRHSHGLFWLAVAILLALPLYQYGPSNDTMLRLSTPCLLILMMICLDQIRSCAESSLHDIKRSALPVLGLVLLIGAHTPFNEIWRALTFRRTPPNYGMTLVDTQHGSEVPHYVGRLDRPDLIAMLRAPGRVPTCNERALGNLVVKIPCDKITPLKALP